MKTRTTLQALMTVGLILALSTTAWSGTVMLVGTGSGSLQHNGTTKIDILDPDDNNSVDTAEWGTHPTIANWPAGQPSTNNGYNNTSGEHWGRVFDNNTGSKVCCSFNPGTSSLTVTSATSQYSISGYTISTGNDDYGRQPDGWRLFGSTDNFGSSNVLLDTVVRTDFQGGAGFTQNQQVGEVTLGAATAPYSSVRIIFDDTDSPNAFQISEVEIFGVFVPPYDTTLTSIATNDWHQAGTWTGGPPNVPTADSLANVHNGHTVTVATGNPGLALEVDIDSASTLQVNDTLTVGTAVAVAAGGTLNAPGTLNAAEVNTAGTTTLTGGGTIGTVNVTGGTGTLATPTIGTLDVSGGQAVVGPGGLTVTNLTVGPAGTVTTTGNLNATDMNLGGTVSISDADIATTGGKLKLGGTLNASGTVNVTGDTQIAGKPNLDVASGHLKIDVPAAGGFLPGILGYWSFDDGTADDSSGNNNHGTATGGTGNPYGPVAYTASTPNGSAMALDLTGGGDNAVWVDTGGSQDVFDGKNAMTIATWAKGDAGGWAPFICKGESGWQMRKHGGGPDMDWTTRGLTSSDWGVPNSSAAFNNNWHFIVMTYDGAQKKFYMYGDDLASPVIQSVNATGTISPRSDLMVFGARDRDNNGNTLDGFFNGYLDDISFYNRALTQAEVEQLYASTSAASFGDLTMAAGSQLSLNSDGSGEASFDAITAGDGATIHGNVSAGDDVKIGSSVGTLNIDGNYTQAAGSTYKWEADGGGSDTIAVTKATGNLDVSENWNLEVTPLDHSVNMNGQTLMSSAGTITGPPGATVSLADNVYADLYDVSGATVTESGGNIVLGGVTQNAKTVSNAGGDWGTGGSWDNGVPDAGKAAVVAGGTVTSTGGTAKDVAVAGGDLNVHSGGLLTVDNNVRIGAGSELMVDGAGTLVTVGNEAKVYAGGTLHLSNGGALGSTVKILGGGTLKTSGNQTLPDNVEFDPAGTLRVAAGTLTVPAGGSMPTGNVLWLDATDIQGNGTATVGGVPVTVWTDKSGAGHNGTNGGDPTTFIATGNIPTVRFDGNDWIRTNLNIDASVQPNVTIFAVYDYRQVAGDDSLWGQEDGGWDRFTLLAHGVGPGISNGGGMYTVSEMGQAGIGFVINEIQMAEGVSNGSHVLINGNAPSNGGIFTINGSAGGPANLFAIGAQNANSGTWPTMMDVAEFLVFDRVLTADEQNDIGGYLAAKYGLTTGYTGGFGVKLGNLVVDGGATLDADGGPIRVNDLGGAGTVNADVTVGGQASPGDSVGTLTITGDLTVADGAGYLWELGPGGYDSILMGGALTLAGDWTLMLSDAGGAANPGDMFYLFQGFTGHTGEIIPMVDPSMVDPGRWDVSGLTFGVDQAGLYMTGLSVRPGGPIGDIPEPATMLLLGMACVGLVPAVRRRLKKV